jgi:hypothetical protein
MSIAKYLALAYNVVGMIPFAIMSADMVKETWPGIKEETCKSGPFAKGPCSPSLEFTTGCIYCQVVAGVAFFFASLIAFPGEKGMLAAMGCMVCTMAKHISIDGLMPPPPVMAMTAAVVLTLVFAGETWGKRAFVAYCALNAFTFFTNPLMVLTDTFPDITPDTEAFKIGSFLLEVIGLYMLMAAAYTAIPSKTLGLAIATQIGATVLVKHVLQYKLGPPTPMIVLYAAATIAAWYENGWTNFKPAAETAIKKGPMKMHATLLITGFIPYFVAESFGISFPMVGMASIDTSYAFTGMTQLLFGMLAIFTAMTAYSEWFGFMEGKMFAAYHYALSPVVFLWQSQPSTSTLGVAFFAAPHMFTLWSIYIAVTKIPAKKA